MIVDGLHVPANALLDVDGNVGAVLFWHSGPIAVKVGVSCGVITTFIVAVVAHCPAVGVKVYVPFAVVLIVDGLQVPFILLLDVAGSDGAVLFWHSGPMAVNAGVICAVITISIVTTTAHCPAAAGVNV